MPRKKKPPVYEIIGKESDELTETRESLMERTERVLSEPGFMEKIYDAVTMGGSLADIADARNIRYSALSKFVNTEKNKDLMVEALDMRRQYVADKIFKETALLASSDVRKLFNDDGTLKPPTEWPEDVARAVDNLEIKEVIGIDGEKVAEMKRVKLGNKLQALKLLGSEVNMFVDKKEHGISDDLKSMIENSYSKEAKEVKDAD
jgi:hypothetical protein